MELSIPCVLLSLSFFLRFSPKFISRSEALREKSSFFHVKESINFRSRNGLACLIACPFRRGNVVVAAAARRAIASLSSSARIPHAPAAGAWRTPHHVG
jgi:hypothetical protein